MRIAVRVRPRSKTEEVTLEGETYVVRVKELPVEGRANRAALKALARYLRVPQNRLRIVSGLTARNKVVEVMPAPGGQR